MGISNLSGKSLSSIIIPLPPLSEQKMIVDFLRDFGENALDENREYFDLEIENDVVSIHQAQIYNNQISTELNHQLALVKELRQAYLREAIQGNLVPQDSADEPAEILLEKIKEEKDKLVAEKKIRKENLQFTTRNLQTENLFEIPANWAWGKLGTICHLITDGTHHTPSYKETGIPFISVKNISKGSIDFSDTKFISEEEHNELIKRCNPEFGDILLTKVGTTGIAKVVDTARTFSIFVSVALLKFNQTLLNGKFLEFVINSPFVKKQSDDGTWGVGNKNLVLKTIMQFSIPIPPLAEQERIVTKLEKLMKFCDELEANIRQGITNADRLLQTALKEALEDR
jgi:type I restriction enzyme S subunit